MVLQIMERPANMATTSNRVSKNDNG